MQLFLHKLQDGPMIHPVAILLGMPTNSTAMLSIAGACGHLPQYAELCIEV